MQFMSACSPMDLQYFKQLYRIFRYFSGLVAFTLNDRLEYFFDTEETFLYFSRLFWYFPYLWACGLAYRLQYFFDTQENYPYFMRNFKLLFGVLSHSHQNIICSIIFLILILTARNDIGGFVRNFFSQL